MFRRRTSLALSAFALLAIGVAILVSAGGSSRARVSTTAYARPPRGHRMSRVTLSDYRPVPEAWFRGRKVYAPGLSGLHRVDWVYSGSGLVMEADGLTPTGQPVHVDEFGHELWVNARGQPTQPTPSASGRTETTA